MGFEMLRSASVNRGRLAYHETGSGEPLIMHHGGESNRHQYAALTSLLAAGVRSITYDQRDVGDSFTAAEPYTTGDIADDCVQLMDALGIEKAHIMGFSFGGVVTLHVGIRHPDRVQTLIAGAVPVRFADITDHAKRIMDSPPSERAELMLQALLSPRGQADGDLVATVRRRLTTGSAGADLNRMSAMRAPDVDDELRAVTAPTLLLFGSDDPLVRPATGQFIANRMPNAQLEIVEHARHGLSSEFTEPVAKLVSDFVLRHPIVH